MNDKKKVAAFTASGAVIGAVTSSAIGGMGLTVLGTGVGMGMAPVTAVGAVVGLAGFGIYKAFGGQNKK